MDIKMTQVLFSHKFTFKGFPLTANDQLDYNRFLAYEAHSRNLSVGLKNDLDQVSSFSLYLEVTD